MSPPPDLPNLHVGEGARRLALKLLDDAARAPLSTLESLGRGGLA